MLQSDLSITRKGAKMKSSKGITLISLITYIVGMVIAVAIISTITTYFSKNVSLSDLKNTEIEYSKFSSVFTKEIHIKNNKVIECYTQGEGTEKISYIIFSTGNQYTYMAQDKSIFKNKINFKIIKFVKMWKIVSLIIIT